MFELQIYIFLKFFLQGNSKFEFKHFLFSDPPKCDFVVQGFFSLTPIQDQEYNPYSMYNH